MGLFQRAKQTIGLDVGSGFIKAVAVDHGGDEPRLVRLASLPLASDAIVEGEIMDPRAVVDAIQEVVQALGVKARGIATAVGGRDVIVKKIRMDRLSEADAREVLHWEAEQYVPFDMESVQLDFQVLDPQQEGPQMSVLLVAAKRDLVEQRLMLLADAGLTAPVVDVDAFALFNALEHNYPSATRGVGALVNVGNEVSTIVVHQDGVPLLTREVPFGSRQVRDDLRRLLGIPQEEAESIVHGRVTVSPEVGKLLQERGGDLAESIERATAFLADENGSAGLQKVNLCGGGARIPRLQEAISERVRVRVEVLNPFQRLAISPEALGNLPGEESAAMWMLPIGLALRASG